MKKKIIHVLNSSAYAGAENVVIKIIKSMEKLYDSYYASPNGKIENVLKREKINYISILNMSPSEIRRIVKEYRPACIHAHDFRSSIICAMANVNVPIISHLHNNPPWIRKVGIYSLAYLISTIKYKKILFVSEAVLNEYVFKSKIKKKSEVVNNPIDTNEILERANELGFKERVCQKCDLIFVGRLEIVKQPLEFIEIVEKLKKEMKINAIIIGQGNLQEKCKSEIKKRNLEKDIEMIGFVDNPYMVMKNAKILCITSKWEGYGLVAVEALTLGIPVITTSVGGIREIVNEKCGKLCENQKQFIDEIKLLLNDENYYFNKSKNAREMAKKIDNKEKYFSYLKEIYELYMK